MPKRFTYSKGELENFLDIIEDVLPNSLTAWECIAEGHSLKYPNIGQRVDSLTQKFKELHNTRIPTSDPNCSPAVVQAKCLRHQIVNKMDETDLNSVMDWRWMTPYGDAVRNLDLFRGQARSDGLSEEDKEKEDDGVDNSIRRWSCIRYDDGIAFLDNQMNDCELIFKCKLECQKSHEHTHSGEENRGT
jgi:hypothetical protein